MDVVAIPAAFAISSTLETLTLGTVLFLKLRSRSQAGRVVANVLLER
jgi:hypothetical protein